MTTRTTSSNPFSPGLTDDERAALLDGRVVVQETSDGLICRHKVSAYHKYLPRGDLSQGGHRDRNLIQFFTAEGKQTMEIRQIKKVEGRATSNRRVR